MNIIIGEDIFDVPIHRFLITGKKIINEIYNTTIYQKWVESLNGNGLESSDYTIQKFQSDAISLAEDLINGQYGRLDFCYRAVQSMKKNYTHFIRL